MTRLVTAALPGTGGALKTTPEDFLVEELPAYLPSGQGSHTFLFVEKRGLTTEEALQHLCRALGVARDAAGAAGMKDCQAVTRQWLSLPDVDPAQALALALPGLRVLRAERHGNKLKTGHLHGNRFTIVLRGLACDDTEARARAEAVLTALATSGLPNYFGPQRFGARGDNAERGRAMLVGGDGAGRRVPRGERRLYVSAFQSALFNTYLDARIEDALLRTALLGDVLRKRDSGGLFTVDAESMPDAQARLASGAIDVTGPMFGSRMRAPTPGSAAGDRETALWAGCGVPAEALARAGAIAEGTRRPITVPVGEPEVTSGPAPGTLQLAFSLPSGAYATVLVAEITKTQKPE